VHFTFTFHIQWTQRILSEISRIHFQWQITSKRERCITTAYYKHDRIQILFLPHHTHARTHARAHAHTHTHTHREKLVSKNVAEAHFRSFFYLCLMMYEMHLKHLLHRDSIICMVTHNRLHVLGFNPWWW